MARVYRPCVLALAALVAAPCFRRAGDAAARLTFAIAPPRGCAPPTVRGTPAAGGGAQGSNPWFADAPFAAAVLASATLAAAAARRALRVRREVKNVHMEKHYVDEYLDLDEKIRFKDIQDFNRKWATSGGPKGTGEWYRNIRRWSVSQDLKFPLTWRGKQGPDTGSAEYHDAQRYLEDRVKGLQEITPPMTDEEWNQEVKDHYDYWMPWHGQRDLQQKEQATMKRRYVTSQRKFFSEVTLFKPLAIKHPTLMRLNMLKETVRVGNEESRTMVINPLVVKDREETAGFTYEDFAKVMTSEEVDDWKPMEAGDPAEGVVVDILKSGAIVEMGEKTWAWLPKDEISVAPILHPNEMLDVGQTIRVIVQKTDCPSFIPSDMMGYQTLVSMKKLQRVAAFDMIEKKVPGRQGLIDVDGDNDPLEEVLVLSMRQNGAVVRMVKYGLEGFIPSSHLADRAGDSTLIGEKLKVEVLNFDRVRAEEEMEKGQAGGYSLTFSYRNAASKELARTLKEGDVVSGTVATVRDNGVDVEVNGIRCMIKNIDMTNQLSEFRVRDIFSEGMEIKAYVLTVATDTGMVRLSTRALERQRGMMLSDPQKVFDNAEATAKKFFASVQAQKEQMAKSLQSVLDVESTDGTGKDDTEDILGTDF